MRTETDIYVPMRDGVAISVDLHLPDEGAGPYPAILTRTPYIKNAVMTGIGFGAMGYPRTSPVGPLAAIARAMIGPEFLTSRGYAVVVSDTRGTGYAEGDYDYYNFVGGPYDGYDTVEWIAAQPWCDGNVGMHGASAGGILAYAAAMTQPPHLRAIMANMHPADFYADQWFVGGVYRYEDRINWATGQQARLAPLDPGDPAHPSYERKRAVYRHRYDRVHRRVQAKKAPVDLDWLTEMYHHPTDDDFWRGLSLMERLDEVRVPVLHAGVLYDHFGRATIRIHERQAGVPTRLYMAPGAVDSEGKAADGGLPELTARWFDRFLRGEQNGVTEEPRLRMYLTGAERWVDAAGWPPPGTVERELHLSTAARGGDAATMGGCLGDAPGGPADAIAHDPSEPNHSPRDVADCRDWERRALTYTSEPLAQPLQVVGLPHLRAWVQSDAIDVDICVRLADVAPDGRSRFLNYGALKASHRAGHERPEPLTPGEPVELDIEIWPVTHVFEPGHRVRVSIGTSDFPALEVNPLPSSNVVLHDAAHPSRLVLPVVEG